MMYNVFPSESEALEAEQADTDSLGLPGGVTIRWAIPNQRLDGKWVYPVCPSSTHTYTTELFDNSWFPTEEI